MRTFKKMAAQGDVVFRKIDKLPTNATPLENKGPVIVALSETHHHHMFSKDSGVTMYEIGDPMICYLRVESASLLEHHRPFDTHESISFSPGIYEVRRQREYTPEGFRRVED